MENAGCIGMLGGPLCPCEIDGKLGIVGVPPVQIQRLYQGDPKSTFTAVSILFENN